MFAGGVTPGKVTNSTATFCAPVVPHAGLCASVVPGLTANMEIAVQAANCRTSFGRAIRCTRPNVNKLSRASAGQRTSSKEDSAARSVAKIAEEADTAFCEMM